MSRYAPQPAAASNTTIQPYGRGIVRVIWRDFSFVVPSGVYKIRVHCMGAGGSGSMIYFNYGIGRAGFARGAGGGGYAIKEITVSPGDVFTCTMGVRGAAVTSTGGATQLNGLAGTTTSFGSAVSATGGLGGIQANGSMPASTFLGGTGVGGDLNFKGGDGGTIQLFTGVTVGSVATGGGAAGTIYGDGASGIRVAATGVTTINLRYGTGGGGAGSREFTITPATGGSLTPYGGLGAGVTSYDTSTITGRFSLTNTNTLILPATVLSAPAPYLLNGIGGLTPSQAAGDGGGGGGYAADGSSPAAGACNPGLFAGGGGCYVEGAAGSFVATGGQGTYGSGGGASVCYSDSGTSTSGAGGAGLIIVEY